jgi:hypothetical protein
VNIWPFSRKSTSGLKEFYADELTRIRLHKEVYDRQMAENESRLRDAQAKAEAEWTAWWQERNELAEYQEQVANEIGGFWLSMGYFCLPLGFQLHDAHLLHGNGPQTFHVRGPSDDYRNKLPSKAEIRARLERLKKEHDGVRRGS